MSYDLMVFDPAAAPRSRAAFMDWYQDQTGWTESHGYNDPEIPIPQLRAWFRELIETFPPLNGPLASDDVDDPRLTDYSLGRLVVYAAFGWSEAKAAYERTLELAEKHRVGFFDVSGEGEDIWIPTADGKLERTV